MLARHPRDIGLLIRSQRKKLGLDQAELAARVGVSRQWIVEIEKGKPRAELGLVLRTLQVLALDLEIAPRDAQRVAPASSASAAINLDDVIARARGKRR